MRDTKRKPENGVDGNVGEHDVAEVAEANRAWKSAFEAYRQSDLRETVDFFAPAQEAFRGNLADGRVSEGDWHIYLRSWVQHNIAFAMANSDLFEEGEEQRGTNARPGEAVPRPTGAVAASPTDPAALNEDEAQSDEVADAVWDVAFDAVCGSPGDLAVNFLWMPWLAFDELLAQGAVRADDRELFLDAFAAHALKHIQGNPALLNDAVKTLPTCDGWFDDEP